MNGSLFQKYVEGDTFQQIYLKPQVNMVYIQILLLILKKNRKEMNLLYELTNIYFI